MIKNDIVPGGIVSQPDYVQLSIGVRGSVFLRQFFGINYGQTLEFMVAVSIALVTFLTLFLFKPIKRVIGDPEAPRRSNEDEAG
jgi:hypothetical protein